MYYRKVQDPNCGDVCLPSKIGVCPRSIVVSKGGLEAGKCADKGYTVDKGEQDQKAGPCGTLKLELWAKAVQNSVAPTGKYEGSVPAIIDIKVDFTGATTADFDVNVKAAHQEIKCPGETVAISDTAVTFPNIANTGDCMGDALRGQKKDVTK